MQQVQTPVRLERFIPHLFILKYFFNKYITMTNRKFCVGGNWKMNGDKKSINDICAFLKAGPLDPNVEVIIKHVV